MVGYSIFVHIINFIELGNWCVRYYLQRTSGAMEGRGQACGPVWAQLTTTFAFMVGK